MMRLRTGIAFGIGRVLLCGLILFGFTGCAGFKIVRIPIPIPTFGIGGGPKTAQATPPSESRTSRRAYRDSEDLPANGTLSYGLASWYGKEAHRHRTASGEAFNMYDLTAAHPTLPFGTHVRVTNIENGRSCVVRINDRGPFGKNRIIDVSLAAARELDFENKGITQVKVEVM